MFFICSKIFQYLCSPLTWIVLLFIVTIIYRRKEKLSKQLQIIALAMICFFSNSFIIDELLRLWEPKAKQKTELFASYDYGILLTGMITYDTHYKRINFGRSADRLTQTLELYKEGRIKKIFITGGSGEVFNQEFKESIILRDYLIKIGVPKEDIEIESNSRNTYENALESSKILKSQINNKTFLLITSAYHMRRSSLCFRKQGFKFDTYVTDRLTGSRRFDLEYLLIPKPLNLEKWYILIHELIGCASYWITGKV